MLRRFHVRVGSMTLALAAMVVGPHLRAEDGEARLQTLAEQNRQLAEQVRAQQKTIDQLSARMTDLMRAAEQQERTLKGLQDRVGAEAPSAPPAPDREHEVRISGEAGLAMFSTGYDGPFPKSEFRVDDPVIAVEAPVWKNVYAFGELKLLTRESSNENFQLGEFYVDFENVSGGWGRPDLLSFRAGRINTPFGEEYQVRGPVANPLISHSLSDIWGTDEGAEVYGRVGALHYVLAVQNGGSSRLHDYNADKAIVARLGWDPSGWLHLSASAMRTGELSPTQDALSDLWFGNSFFRSIGSASSTTAFWANLMEADAKARWNGGHLAAAAGVAHYGDNDRTADNSRRLRYGYIELVQNIADRLYGAARYSAIRAPRGYPIAGGGQPGEYFFRPSLTEELSRLSVGLGYRFAPPLAIKVEYSWNRGRQLAGERRDGEDFLGTEIAVKF